MLSNGAHFTEGSFHEHQPIVKRRPAQCWRPHLSGETPGELLRLVMCKHRVQPSTGCYYAGIPGAEQFHQIDLSCHIFPLQQVSTSSQKSNTISQGRTTEFTKSRTGKQTSPFHGCISGAPGHLVAEDLAETSDREEQLLPFALHCSGSLLPGEAILKQRGESETACAQTMGLPTQPGFANMHCMCVQYPREFPEQGMWTLKKTLFAMGWSCQVTEESELPEAHVAFALAQPTWHPTENSPVTC